MLNITTDSNGFKVAELDAQAGGRIVISNYGAEYITDIGSVSSVNSHGLGGNDWIRSVADIERHIGEIQNTHWLTEAEQQTCIEFLRAVAE
jgi:hypothetical protein